MFSTSAISFVIAMIFSSIIGTSFLDKGYHLRDEIGRWGEVNVLFSMMEMSMLASTSPAKPLSSVEARQHGKVFFGLPASLLASTSPQNLCLPLGHANMLRIF